MTQIGSIFPLLAAAAAGLAATGLAATGAEAVEPQAHRLHRDHVLGTSLDMVAVGGDRAAADAALAAALAEIDRLEPILSGWRADSELSRLNGSAGGEVSPELYAVIAAAEAWRRHTGGAFDGRLGEVEALWRRAAAEGVIPHTDDLVRAAGEARREAVGLDPVHRRVERPEGALFALDGLAKGYVIDAALAAARAAAPSLKGLMLDIGGDMAAWGQGPAWTWAVGVSDPLAPEDNAAPEAVMRFGGGGVASSGRGLRDLEVGGGTYGLRLLPDTGAPSNLVLSATAVAPCAMDADALATALSVLEPHAGLSLVERTPGAEALIVDAEGRRHASSGWAGLASAPPPQLIRTAARAAAPAAGPAWPTGFVVSIDYELPRPNDTPVYSPYVAIWVTDAANRPIRQVLLQGDDFNYIDQNYVWWRRYGRGAPAVVDSTARPTRPAGRYTAVWDGRDQNGQRAPQGRYTIHIEAIREHGLHSYQAIPLELGAQPAEGKGAPGDELGASRVRYGRR